MNTRNSARVAFVAIPAAIAALAVGGGACGKARHITTPSVAASELNLEIVSLQLPASAGDVPRVTFRATDRNGAPVDVLAELARASSKAPPYIDNGPRFTLAQVEPDGSNTNWYESTVNPAAFTPPEGVTPSPAAATQPGFQQAPASNPSSRITANGDGSFTFAFTAPTTDAGRRSASKPMTAGIWMERIALRQTGGPKRWPAGTTRTFGAGGAAASPHEAVSDAACNTCHVVLRAHDRRESVQLCLTCHSGGAGITYRDPESGENIDFRSMIHRIHLGADLPSVRAGGHFFLVGFQQGVSDFSDAELPPLRSATECTVCHAGGANADAWKTNASFVACTSCHDNVRFDGSAAATPCRLGTDEAQPCEHALSPEAVTAASNCAQCHTPGASSPAIGPDVVHRNALVELASHWKYEILSVTAGADRKPVVQFRVSKDGAANDVLNDPAWKQGASSRLFVDIAWPTTEFTNEGAGFVDATVKSAQYPAGVPGQGQPVQVNALTAATPVAGQANVFQVTSPTAVPAQFSSIRVVLEGHPAEGTGATALRVPVPNAVHDAALGGGAVAPRRQIVSADTCNKCHGELSAHGANRNLDPAVCVVCHNPRDTDLVRVVQAQNLATGATPDAKEDTIDFKVLVHAIHAADIRKTPMTIYGFGGRASTFPAAFPGETGRCTICHVNDSFKLPLAQEVLDTTVQAGDPTAFGDAAEKIAPRTTAVCTACHDMVRFDAAAQRPACNTLVPVNSAECTHSGGAQGDESQCAACHGSGKAFDVAQVHAITDRPQ